jgi:hypothetical protein
MVVVVCDIANWFWATVTLHNAACRRQGGSKHSAHTVSGKSPTHKTLVVIFRLEFYTLLQKL